MSFPEVEEMKSLSRNLFKANYIHMDEEDTRIIDTNQMVSKRLDELRSMLQQPELEQGEPEFIDGLEAAQVAALLDEDAISQDSTEGNILKAAPVYTGPSPEELIAEAEEEIARMKQEAQEECKRLQKEAMEAGKQEGYQAGYEEGKKAFDGEKIKLELEEEELKAAYQKKREELEPVLIGTLTDIYTHVFQVSLEGVQEIVMHLLNSTVERLEGHGDFLVHVSKEDFPYVNAEKKTLLENNAVSGHIEIIEDITLKKNQCYIETDGGIFDCSLEVELAGLAKELRLLSYGNQSEQI